MAAVSLLATEASLPGWWWWCRTLPGMRFAGTRNTLRWSLDARDELGLTLCFTVPTVAAAEAAPPTIVPAVAPSPLRAPFLVPLPLPPLPTAATAGGLKSVVVVAPRSGADELVTGVVAAVDDPDWLLAEGTRLSGEVVHFNSMTFWGGHYFASSAPSSSLFAQQ